MADYAVTISSEGYLIADSVPAYAVGTGNFSFGAWVQTTTAGVIASLLGSGEEDADGSGWVVYVDDDLSLCFLTSDANQNTYQVSTAGTPLNDGCWHHVAAVRDGATLFIYVDGQPQNVASAASGDGVPPFDFSAAPMQIGSSDGSWYDADNMTGDIQQVTLWNTALTQAEVSQLLTCSVNALDGSLIGYWTLLYSLEDGSGTGNRMIARGSVPFTETFDADVCYGGNQYCYASFTNTAGGMSASVTRSQLFAVAESTPALIISLTASREDFSAPAGVALTVLDPDGNTYASAQNSETVFVRTADGVPTLIAVVNPVAGNWTVTATANGRSPFVLAFQTVPNSDIAATIQATLEPVYGSAPYQSDRLVVDFGLGGLPSWVVAGAIVVGAAIAAASIIVTAGVTAPAVLAAIAIIGSTEVVTAVALTKGLTRSGDTALTQAAANLMQLDPSTITVILADADYDPLTRGLLQAREEKTYLYAVSSAFQRTVIQRAQFTNAEIVAALQNGHVGYLTASSHGLSDAILGWPQESKNEFVLKSGTYPKQAVSGIIFHFLACYAGRDCGPALVTNGASAFLGYTERFQYTNTRRDIMLEPDMVVDEQLLNGATVGAAQAAAVEMFNKNIALLRDWGNLFEAAMLQGDRDAFVGPNTDAKYGSTGATITRRPIRIDGADAGPDVVDQEGLRGSARAS